LSCGKPRSCKKATDLVVSNHAFAPQTVWQLLAKVIHNFEIVEALMTTVQCHNIHSQMTADGPLKKD
jgi:hypothetical protein